MQLEELREFRNQVRVESSSDKAKTKENIGTPKIPQYTPLNTNRGRILD